MGRIISILEKTEKQLGPRRDRFDLFATGWVVEGGLVPDRNDVRPTLPLLTRQFVHTANGKVDWHEGKSWDSSPVAPIKLQDLDGSRSVKLRYGQRESFGCSSVCGVNAVG